MYGIFNLIDKVKKYFMFSKEELKSLVIAILILGFVIGFDDGSETFEFMNWLRNLFSSILIVTLAIFAREVGHRVHALQTGYRAEIKLWWVGLIGSLVMAVISFGKIPILIYGGIVVHFMERHRIGYFRQWQSYGDMGIIALMGSLMNLLLAFFFKLFLFMPNTALIEKAIMVNVLMASINMLPIPPLDGSMVLFASRSVYVYTFSLIIVASALIMFASLTVTIIGAIVIAALMLLAFSIMVENK